MSTPTKPTSSASFSTPSRAGTAMYDVYSPSPKTGLAVDEFYANSATKVKQCEESMSSLRASAASGSGTPTKTTPAPYTPSPRPSHRAAARMDRTDVYLTQSVDPVMTNAVKHLLLVNPQDIRGALVTYFMKEEQGGGEEAKSKFINKVGGGVDPKAGEKRKELMKKADKYIVKLSELCVLEQPENVVKFCIATLEKWEESSPITM